MQIAERRELRIIDKLRDDVKLAKQSQTILTARLRLANNECESLRMENEKLRVKLAEAKKNGYI